MSRRQNTERENIEVAKYRTQNNEVAIYRKPNLKFLGTRRSEECCYLVVKHQSRARRSESSKPNCSRTAFLFEIAWYSFRLISCIDNMEGQKHFFWKVHFTTGEKHASCFQKTVRKILAQSVKPKHERIGVE